MRQHDFNVLSTLLGYGTEIDKEFPSLNDTAMVTGTKEALGASAAGGFGAVRQPAAA